MTRQALQNQPVTIRERDLVDVSNSVSLTAVRKAFTPEPGMAHRYGRPVYLSVMLLGKPSSIVFDSGACPSVITAKYLSLRDPRFEERLLKRQGLETKGFGGTCKVLGVYPCSLAFPHPQGSLTIDIEFLVLSDHRVPYQMILGRDAQTMYSINLVTPQDPSKDAYVQFARHKQRWAVLHSSEPVGPMLAANIAPDHAPFPSVRDDVRYEDYLKTLEQPLRKASTPFLEQFQDVHISPNLSEQQRFDLKKVIFSCQDVFAIPGQDYEFIPLGEPVHLDVTVPQPPPKGLKKAPYPVSNKAKKDIREAVASALSKGQIRPSNSPYAAPTFVVYRDTKVRVIHDWREINALMKVPAHPIPNMQNIIRDLRQAKYLTSIDIMDAFMCMELDEESKKYTAFVTEEGLWEWNVCSFGLASFPGEFQSRMNKVFQVAIFASWLKAYIDDLLLHHRDWDAHLWGIYMVLHTLRLLGCHVKMKKAFFGFQELTYVGHKLNGLTLALEEGRVAAVRDWPTPTSRAQLRRFLGFTGYHQQFVPHYASICVPLTDLLSTSIEWKWSERHQKAVEDLKTALCNTIALYMPDFERPFIVYTDASDVGLAAGLYQADDQKVEHPIVFISRKLKDTEKRYGASNLECLAVVWMLDKLHFYLDGAQFSIVTDCIAVRSLLTAKWTHRQLIRWQAAIQAYRGRITIRHRAGTMNDNADGPSRAPLPNTHSNPAADLDPDQSIEIGGIAFDLAAGSPTLSLASSLLGEGGEPDERGSGELQQWLDSPSSSRALQQAPVDPPANADDRVGGITSAGLSRDFAQRLTKAYHDDDVFSKVLKLVKDNAKSIDQIKSDEDLPPNVMKDIRAGRFYVLDDLLYRRHGLTSALVICDSYLQTQVLDLSHDHLLSGHQGTDRTFERVRTVAWWPGLHKAVEAYVSSCKPCQLAKRRTTKPPGHLQEIGVPDQPWEVIHMDFVSALPSAGENLNAVLVITCRLSKAIVLIPMETTADSVRIAQLFYQFAVPRIGIPKVIISDRDPKFVSDFWSTLNRLFGTKLAMSTAHHPQTDGLAERAIGSLEEALRTFCAFGSTDLRGDLTVDWVMVLPAWEYAYNSAKHASTGQIPYVLERGYCPRGPLAPVQDLAAPGTPKVDMTASAWVEAISHARERARNAIKDAFAYTKSRWDRNRSEVSYTPGDQVRLSSKFFDFKGTAGKLKPAWIGPFEVVAMKGPNAVELSLPAEYKARHPVFPVMLTELHKTTKDFQSRREHETFQPAVEADDDGEDLFEIDFIRSERTRRTKDGPLTEYLVHWKGWGVEYDSWEELSDEHAPDLLASWRQQRPSRRSRR